MERPGLADWRRPRPLAAATSRRPNPAPAQRGSGVERVRSRPDWRGACQTPSRDGSRSRGQAGSRPHAVRGRPIGGVDGAGKGGPQPPASYYRGVPTANGRPGGGRLPIARASNGGRPGRHRIGGVPCRRRRGGESGSQSAPRASPSGGRHVSPDPLVADLANGIEAVVGVLVETNVTIRDAGRNTRGEIDILGPDFVVEVTTSANELKKSRQLVRTIRPNAAIRGIVRIAVFAPNAEPEWTAMVERTGFPVHSTHEQVYRWITSVDRGVDNDE